MPDYTIHTTSRTRILPSKHSLGANPKVTPLSVLDATVVSYSPTAGAWFFDAPLQPAVFHIESLQKTLAITLDAYPQWTGQIGWASYDPSGGGGHTQRFRRPQLVWGTSTDPGVDFAVANCTSPMTECIPDVSEKTGIEDGWDAGVIRNLDLLQRGLSDLALRDVSAPVKPGAPGVIIQVTTFACGGIAIAVGITHALADATTLLGFVRDWAAVHRAHLSGSSIPELSPVFEPKMVDALAAGDVDAREPDSSILSRARELPIHRFDLWIDTPGRPVWACPPDIDVKQPHEEGGTPLPWNEWDATVPIERVVFYFSPAAIARMHAAASIGGATVSKLDALLAFIWALNARARAVEDDAGAVYIDMTLGVRPRTRPPLPHTFVGSPLINIFATLPTSVLVSPSSHWATIASSIRQAVHAFDEPDAIPAYLYERAFDGCPHARWVAFFGLRHTLITSWLGLDAYGIDFGSGCSPKHVESVMPDVDGCIQIMEAGTKGNKLGKWYEETVGVRMHLRKDVMQKVMSDSMLRMYDN